jgi:predicted transcriptional regulator
MQKTPCEYMLWQGLPIIRKEIVNTMIKNFGLSQKEAAEKLGITPSAVSQYKSRKRGKINITNNDILLEINMSAEKIIKHGKSIVPQEICKICRILRKHNILSFSIIEY